MNYTITTSVFGATSEEPLNSFPDANSSSMDMLTLQEMRVQNAVKWAPCLVVLAVASIAGTFGNLMILLIIHKRKTIQNVECTFIVNLALTDLYVTSLADPMSFIGMSIIFYEH